MAIIETVWRFIFHLTTRLIFETHDSAGSLWHILYYYQASGQYTVAYGVNSTILSSWLWSSMLIDFMFWSYGIIQIEHCSHYLYISFNDFVIFFVTGKIFEIGSTGISSLGGHSERRTECVNRFAAVYGRMPLVSTSVKAVDSRNIWFWWRWNFDFPYISRNSTAVLLLASWVTQFMLVTVV